MDGEGLLIRGDGLVQTAEAEQGVSADGGRGKVTGVEGQGPVGVEYGSFRAVLQAMDDGPLMTGLGEEGVDGQGAVEGCFSLGRLRAAQVGDGPAQFVDGVGRGGPEPDVAEGQIAEADEVVVVVVQDTAEGLAGVHGADEAEGDDGGFDDFAATMAEEDNEVGRRPVGGAVTAEGPVVAAGDEPASGLN